MIFFIKNKIQRNFTRQSLAFRQALTFSQTNDKNSTQGNDKCDLSQGLAESLTLTRTKYHTFLLGILILLISACQTKKDKNTQAFFYPMEKWAEGMVYEYHPVNNAALPPEYWYFRKLETDTTIYFTGQYYDNNFTPRQIFNGKILDDGLVMTDYILYEYDSLQNVSQRPAEILAPKSFPFEQLENTQSHLLKLNWKNPTEEYPNGYLEMTRKRKYTGDTTYLFQGKNYDCIAFQMNELVDDFNDGHLEKEFIGKEFYAKDLGLIYYRKEIDENFVLEYELTDTFSMRKLEEKFKTYLGEEN